MKKHLLFALTLELALASCQSSDEDNANERKYIPLTRNEEVMAEEHIDFAFNFFKEIEKQAAAKGKEIDRLAVSPLSASLASSMLANGTAGETQKEILETLGFSGFSMEEVNAYNRKLAEQLIRLDKKSQVKMANSFWMNRDFKPLSSFTETLGKSYEAEVKQTDFATALPAINRWCSEKTGGLIPDILSDLNPEDSFVLLNALYFKGEWAMPFDKDDNTRGEFTDCHGAPLQTVEYMNKSIDVPCMQNELFSMARLPYGNGAFCMYILLPNPEVTLQRCVEQLNADVWNRCISEMQSNEVTIKLPKYKVEFKIGLDEVLPEMGMKLLFSREADFSSLTDTPRWDMLNAEQACVIEVDEKGVTAASGTHYDGWSADVPPLRVSEFFVTRPFLFLVTEQSTGTILFFGRVSRVNS